MTAPKDGTVRESFDRANPNTLADLFRKIGIGSLLAGQIAQWLRRKTPATTSYNLSTVQVIELPAHAKAASVIRATALVGTVTGELTPAAYGTTPTTGKVAVTPNGDIGVLGTDAITKLDVLYLPERCDVVEAVFPVVSNVLTLPSSLTSKGVVLLAEAESLEGTLVSKMITLVPSDSAPATTKANLNLAKTQVLFATADAVTRARVKLAVCPAEDLATILQTAADTQ